MGKNFTQLQNDLTMVELDSFSKEVMQAYIDGKDKSREIICDEKDITVSCFYKLEEHSIVNWIVTTDMIYGIQLKAISNISRKSRQISKISIPDFILKTAEKYNSLREKRNKNKETALARYYGLHYEAQKYQVARMFEMSTHDFDIVLSTILYDIDKVDKETFENVANRCISTFENKEYAKKFFAKIRTARGEEEYEQMELPL